MLLIKMILRFNDIAWGSLLREPVSMNTLSKDTVLEIGSYLGWSDRLSLLQVNHHYYKNLAEDWFVPTHYQHQELWSDDSVAALSFRKLYALWKIGDDEEKKGIEAVFKSHQFWPKIELFIKSGRSSEKILEHFIENNAYLKSDEIIEVLFENTGPCVYRFAMFKLAVVHVKSPRTLLNLMAITGLHLFKSMKLDKICRKESSSNIRAFFLAGMAKFHVAGCFIKHGIVRPDILTSLLTCYEISLPTYLPRILEDAPLTKDLKLDQFTIGFLHTSDLVNFDLLKLFFSKFPDFRLFLKKKNMMTRWSRRKQKEILEMNIPDWCRTKEAFELALAYFKNPQERVFLLEKLGRVDKFKPSKKSIDTFLKTNSELGLLKLIERFPKIRFTSQHVQLIVANPQTTRNTLLRVFQRAPGVYPVVDLDPLGIDEDTATLIEFAFIFFDRLDSLVYLMRHRIPEAHLIEFLRFCDVRGASVDRIRSASEEFGYSNQFIEAFSHQVSKGF